MADMICEQCGASDAVVHLTQIVSNEMSTHHLCQKCAADKGIQSEEGSSNDQLLGLIDKISGELPDMSRSDATQCDFCDLTFEEFRKTTRLGCPHCYEAFAAQLPSLLRRIHGGERHVGKVYLPPDPSVSETDKRVEGLRRRLERAIQVEDFERAANLRDEIGSLQQIGDPT